MAARIHATPTLHMVEEPRLARRIAFWLIVIFVGMPGALLLVPWQQALSGTGRVVAFDPRLRQQVIESPIEARVYRWHVVEGSRVEAGDPICSLRDPDPDLPDRLRDERLAIANRLERARQRVASYKQQAAQLQVSRTEAVKAADNRLAMAERQREAARQNVAAAKAALSLAAFDYDSLIPLEPQGLVSKIDMQRAQQRKLDAEAKLEAAEQALLAADNHVQAMSAERVRVGTDIEAAIFAVNALEQTAEAEAAAAERDLAQIKVREARQKTQEICAPVRGTVFRILANSDSGGMLVKAGGPLATLVPDIEQDEDRCVEILIHGNDMPLVTEGLAQGLPLNVRLQFEGWPAIQFVGWPSVAVGTFGGVVQIVDPTDDGNGQFRLLVRPDPVEEEYNPWPPANSLRQGVRANAWVLLNRVTIGWELWRRFNGFPPVVAGKAEAPKDPMKLNKVIKK
jgi:multidrug efflux pump subunit AcrA (membrane-fusion protein)